MPSPFVTAMSMPIWADFPYELPEDVECRRKDDLAALVLKGTDKVLGFVPSRFDSSALSELVNRLRES